MSDDCRVEFPPGVELEEAPCPVGCPSDDAFVLTGWDRLHHRPGRFRVVRCRTCGLMRTNPRPTAESIGVYYPQEYGPHQVADVAADGDPGSAPVWKRMLRVPFRFNVDVLPARPQGRMLEVGCGNGLFLYRMQRRGWQVEGLERSASAAELGQALGFRVYAGPLESAPEPREPYDLIVGWMVLEHLHDPVAALSKLVGWTRPGGWLALSVPNAGSLERSLFGDAWYALQVPTHLYHFTPRTLAKMLDCGGWRVERLLHQRILSNLVASVGYRLQDYRVMGKLAERLLAFPERRGWGHHLLYPFAYLLSLFGQTGRMTVWATKKDD